MQGSHVLVVDRSSGAQEIVAQGLVLRQINKDGSHFLIKTFRKGYSVNEVVSLEKLEGCLLFDSAHDLHAFLAENAPRPKAIEAPQPTPPVDNDHIEPGSERFAERPALSLVDPPSDAPSAELLPSI